MGCTQFFCRLLLHYFLFNNETRYRSSEDLEGPDNMLSISHPGILAVFSTAAIFSRDTALKTQALTHSYFWFTS